MFLFMRSLTGVESSKPNARGCLTTGATGWGSCTDSLAFLSCVVCVKGSAALGKRSDEERINEQATLMNRTSVESSVVGIYCANNPTKVKQCQADIEEVVPSHNSFKHMSWVMQQLLARIDKRWPAQKAPRTQRE